MKKPQSYISPKFDPQSHIKQMLSRKKGFYVVCGEELFHQMYNPFYEHWMVKKSTYVNYDKIHQSKKKKYIASFRPGQFQDSAKLNHASEKD